MKVSSTFLWGLGFTVGGCVLNNIFLELIVEKKESPALGESDPKAGVLLSLLHFLGVAVAMVGLVVEFRNGYPALRRQVVPTSAYMQQAGLFALMTVLNNGSLRFVPQIVNIVVRSSTPVGTLLMGWFLFQKRYNWGQIVAAILLAVGTAVVSMRGKKESVPAEVGGAVEGVGGGESGEQGGDATVGMIMLGAVLVLQPFLTQVQGHHRSKYGRAPGEGALFNNVLGFWMVVLALGAGSVFESYSSSSSSSSSTLPTFSSVHESLNTWNKAPTLLAHCSSSTSPCPSFLPIPPLPVSTLWLAVFFNVLTQVACVRGVYLLIASSTPLTVSMVLTGRKVVSFLLSYLLFPNQPMTPTFYIGAAIVFSGAFLYNFASAADRTSKPQPKQAPEEGSGSEEEEEGSEEEGSEEEGSESEEEEEVEEEEIVNKWIQEIKLPSRSNSRPKRSSTPSRRGAAPILEFGEDGEEVSGEEEEVEEEEEEEGGRREQLEGMKVRELKDELRAMGLEDKGRKQQLIDRILSHEQVSEEEEEEEESEVEFSTLRVKELKELLKEAGLPTSGRKDDLVARLEEYQAS